MFDHGFCGGSLFSQLLHQLLIYISRTLLHKGARESLAKAEDITLSGVKGQQRHRTLSLSVLSQGRQRTSGL